MTMINGPGGGLTSRLTRRLWPAALVIALLAAIALIAIPPDPDRLRLQAEADARAGHYERAAVALDRLARLREPTPVDCLLRAQVAGGRGRTDAAVAELAKIPNDHPLAPLARLSQGQLEARRGRLRPAEVAFRATLALVPKSAQARRELVYIYSIQQRLPELDEQLNALSMQGEVELEHLIHWGMVRHTEWSAAADIAPLERYVRADPEDRHSRLALAEAQRRTGRAADVEATLAPLPESDPDARAVRAQLALDRGATSDAKALLEGGPADHPALARLRGKFARAGGDPREAVRQFRIVLAAEPGDRAAMHGLALALVAAGDADAARPIQKALRRDELLGTLLIRARTEGLREPTLPLQIALACADTGRPREARAWLYLVLRRDPTDSKAQTALHQLF